MGKKKGKKVLLESASAGRVLEVSPAQVRKLAEQGLLPIEATTPRGGRLFSAAAVERLRQRREAARRANPAPAGGPQLDHKDPAPGVAVTQRTAR